MMEFMGSEVVGDLVNSTQPEWSSPGCSVLAVLPVGVQAGALAVMDQVPYCLQGVVARQPSTPLREVTVGSPEAPGPARGARGCPAQGVTPVHNSIKTPAINTATTSQNPHQHLGNHQATEAVGGKEGGGGGEEIVVHPLFPPLVSVSVPVVTQFLQNQ